MNNNFTDVITLDKCRDYAGQKVGARESYRICHGILRQLKEAVKAGTGLPDISYYASESKGYIWSLPYKDTIWKIVITCKSSLMFRIIGWGDASGFYPVLGIWLNLKRCPNQILRDTFYQLNRAGELSFGGNIDCYRDYCKDISGFKFWLK